MIGEKTEKDKTRQERNSKVEKRSGPGGEEGIEPVPLVQRQKPTR